MEKNVRPKYVKNKYLIDFGMFVSLLPHCSLIEDIQQSFGDQIDEFLGNEYQSCKPLLGSNPSRTFEGLAKKLTEDEEKPKYICSFLPSPDLLRKHSRHHKQIMERQE